MPDDTLAVPGTKPEKNDRMKPCFYNPDVACNGHADMCDKGKFEAHCIMHALLALQIRAKANQDVICREGWKDAIDFLMTHGWVKDKVDGKRTGAMSVMDVHDLMLAHRKEKGDAHCCHLRMHEEPVP